MKNSVKKLFSVLLSVLLVAGVLPFVALPEAKAADVWDGTWDGSGFSGNHITSAKGLAQFINNAGTGTSYSGQTVYLDVDIDLNGIDFGNISGGKNVYYNRDNYFEGTFDGQGHTIANFRMHNSDHRIGLFRSARNATFKNVTFTNVFIDDNNNDKKNGFAAVVGFGEGNLTFENVHVQSGTIYGYNYVGGLLGEYGANETVRFTNCSNGATIHADNDRAAGLVGHSKGSVVANGCSNTGEIYAGYSDAGGMAGWIEDDESSFVNCSNTGKVSTDACAGGIVGYFGSKNQDKKMTLTGCTNTGYIESRAKVAGGIAGMLDTDAEHAFTDNVNRGDVYGKEDAGGIVGSNIGKGVWNNNKNYGNVRCDNDNCGGILGEVEDDANTFENCYNTGSVQGKNSVGGILGYGQNANHEFYDCGNSGNITATSDCAGGVYGYGNESEPTIEQCWNLGNIRAYNDGGGILGRTYHHSYIRRCFNAGSIGPYNHDNNGAHGGIVGQTSDKSGSSNDNPNMTDCFNWGTVSGGWDEGGLIGKIKDGRTPYYITNSYNAGAVSGGRPFAIIAYGGNVGNNVYYYNGVGMGTIQGNSISDADLKASSGFSGNYCKNTWGVTIGDKTYYYPILTWYRDLFVFHLKFVDDPSGTNAYFDGNYGAGFTTPNPTRTGYTIGDWYDENDANRKMTPNTLIWCGTSAPMNTMTVTQNLAELTDISNTTTFNLNWTPHTYSIVFNRNGMNYGSMDPLPMTYDVEKALPAVGFFREYSVTLNYKDGVTPNATTAVRSDFNGWSTSATGSVVYQDKAAVKNLTAENNGTVNLYANWTSGSMELPVPTREGYTFTGWYTDESCMAGYKVNGSTYYPTEDKTLFAGWTLNTYNVTFSAQGTGYTWNNPAATVSHGGYVTFTVTLKDGYTNSAAPAVTATVGTVSSQQTGSAITYTVSNITGPTAITVGAATINSYTVVFVNGYTGATLKTQNVTHGAAATAPEVPDHYLLEGNGEAHKHFSGWDAAFGSVTGDLTVTAVYADEAHNFGAYTKVDDNQHKRICGTCGYIEQLDHSWALQSTTASTCVAAGSKVYKCADCGAKKTETLPLAAHQYTAQTVSAERLVSAATCQQKAVYYYSCAVCGKAGTETFEYGDFAAHKFETYTPNNDATCTQNGTETAVCAFGCGETDTREIPDSKLAHDWEWLVDDEPTCAEPGLKHQKCKNCPAVQSENTEIPPTGAHDYGELNAAVAPTCTEDGTIAYYECAVCHKLFNESKAEVDSIVDAATGHAYGAWIEATPNGCFTDGALGHYHCDVCGKDFDADKNVLESLTVPAVGSHTLVHVPAKNAGCPNTTGDGHIEYWRCYVCGKYFSDEACEHEIAPADVLIPAAHRPVFIAEKPATATANGVKAHYDCSICGKHYSDEACTVELTDEALVTPATGETPQGDCPLCGKYHDGSIWGRVSRLVHMIVYIFLSMFGKV